MQAEETGQAGAPEEHVSDVTIIDHATLPAYNPNGTIVVTNTLVYEGTLLSLRWLPVLPQGWKIVSVSGDGNPEMQQGEILWTGEQLPSSPVVMTYQATIPLWAFGTNRIEAEAGCHMPDMINPLSAPAQPAPLALAPLDTDGDGLPDGWEAHYSPGPTNLLPGVDSDGDGMVNGHEFIAGTAPNDSNSMLRLGPPQSMPTNAVLVQWPSATNRRYTITRSTNLLDEFTPLAGYLPATPPTNQYHDTPGALTPLFYRVDVE